jgi:hypothetical protein
MKKSVLLVACIISAGIYMAHAEIDENREREELCEMMERERMEMEESESEEIDIFDKNIRLDFQAVPLDKDNKGMFIVTATSHFQSSVRLAGDGSSVIFNVSGDVIPLADSNKIFVSYEVHTIVEGKDGEAMFRLESGVLLSIGKEIALGTLGDKTLMLKASYVD